MSGDPLFPTTPIVIGGNVYELCFKIRALMIAERAMRLQGYDVLLIEAFPKFTIEAVQIMFAAALEYKHSSMPFEERIALLESPSDLLKATDAIAQAWMAASPATKQGPPEPAVVSDPTGPGSGPTPASRSVSRKKSSTTKRRGPSKH